MKPEELRIGNWVYLFGDAVQLTKEHLIYLLQKDGTPDPITLTEEWLLKFGWVWNEECDSYEKYPNGDARMNLSKKTYVYENSYTMFNYVLKAKICDRIYYVHQLQNLYHALTGEELKITSPAPTEAKS